MILVAIDRSNVLTVPSVDALVALSRFLSIPTYPSGSISIVSLEYVKLSESGVSVTERTLTPESTCRV